MKLFSQPQTAEALLREAISAWPQFGPPQLNERGEIIDTQVSGADLVDWFDAWLENVRETLAPPATPLRLAIVIEGGVVQAVVSNRPGELPIGDVRIIDYDGDECAVPQSDGTTSTASVGDLAIEQCEIDLEAIT